MRPTSFSTTRIHDMSEISTACTSLTSSMRCGCCNQSSSVEIEDCSYRLRSSIDRGTIWTHQSKATSHKALCSSSLETTTVSWYSTVMGNVQTYHVEIRSLNSKVVREDVDIAIHNGLRLEQRRILVVDVPAKPCISVDWRVLMERETYLFETTTSLRNASCMSSRIRSSTAGNEISYSQPV